ncbi:MAG: BON domain-containing protein [Burkholderiales bacterium]|jgi:osmotically-inducible protein OsmY
MHPTRRLAVVFVLLGSTLAATGCLPLAATGMAVGAMAALDRRTVGAQTEDTEIELRAGNRMPDAIKGARGVAITSYNRRVLLTGQVPDEASKLDAERAVRQVPGVREVFNELETINRVTFSTAASDTAITARIKAGYVEQKALNSNAVKVVTENGVVYLMGLLTQREGPAYATVASRVGGVRRVVTLYEYVTDEELARITAR